MQLVSYNIQYGRGRDGVFDLERIADTVRAADVIALQEVERFWRRSGMVDQPALIAAALPEHHWVYAPGVDLDASEVDAHGRPRLRRRRQFGNMLLSRTPIVATRMHLLPKDAALGAALSIQRVALEALLATPGGRWLRCYSVHLTHLSAAGRMPQIETLLAAHARAVADGTPLTGEGLKAEWMQDGMPPPMPREAVLMGDFNFEPDSAEYQRLAGPWSEYAGRLTSPEGFVDGWAQAGHAVLDAPPTADIDGRGVRLDYVFVSAALAASVRGAHVDEAADGSDHQPLWLELEL